MKNAHQEKIKVKCVECGKELNKRAYKKHLEEVHGERKFACDLCDYKAQNKYNLQLHVSKTHLGYKEVPKSKCQHCDLVTTNFHFHMKQFHPLALGLVLY